MSDREHHTGSPLPLRVDLSEPAEADIDAGYRWMLRFGFDVAEQWLERLMETIESEAASQSAFRFGRILAAGSTADKPTYRLLFRTGGRRSSSWHVLYTLLDDDEDGVADTLHVVRITHAARA